MLKKTRFPVGAGLLLLAVVGCSDVTNPKLLTSFDWGEVDVPEDVVEGISTSVVFGELFIVGQFNTPTRCYNLNGNFDRSGKTVTVQVTAKPTNSPNCDESLGGWRYVATISNLEFDTYTLRVIHDVTGGSGGQFTETVTIH